MLLVNHNTVRFFKDRLQLGMDIADLAHPVLIFDKNGDLLHRAGPVKRHNGDNILKLTGFELAQNRTHAAAFQLENTRGIPL